MARRPTPLEQPPSIVHSVYTAGSAPGLVWADLLLILPGVPRVSWPPTGSLCGSMYMCWARTLGESVATRQVSVRASPTSLARGRGVSFLSTTLSQRVGSLSRPPPPNSLLLGASVVGLFSAVRINYKAIESLKGVYSTSNLYL